MHTLPITNAADPITLLEVEIKNRIWVSPMCQYSCLNHDGIPNDWHLVHLAQFAMGGAGLVMTEATGVTPNGRITRECAGIWNEEQARAWSRIVDVVHARGAKIGIQLAHAGRKASDYKPTDPNSGSTVPADQGGWTPVAPSPIAMPGFDTPTELTLTEIDEVVQQFATAAVRAQAAGFDVVEIHAAHGYLIHEFLSPLSNVRTDEYGGSFNNRVRLLERIVSDVRSAVGPRMPIFVRFSATDWHDEGWRIEDTVKATRRVLAAGAQLIDASTGGLASGVKIPVGPAYQVPFAEVIRQETGAPVAAVGQLWSTMLIESVLAAHKADAVFVGREMLRDPHFAHRVLHELGKSQVPYQYKLAYK